MKNVGGYTSVKLSAERYYSIGNIENVLVTP